MEDRAKLLEMTVKNMGCIGPEGLTVQMDNIVCLVGANNSGKSTVLRAYEAAVGLEDLSDEDLHDGRGGLPASVEIRVHIPEGAENVAESWKEREGQYLVVRSLWEWPNAGKPRRRTWSPESGNWSEDAKASGLDNVFSSRLPVPLRIDALDAGHEVHGKLMKLLLDPVARELTTQMSEEGSQLADALGKVRTVVDEQVAEFRGALDETEGIVDNAYRDVFPNARVRLSVGAAPVELKALDLLKAGSTFNIEEHEQTIGWQRQGTGAQRTLFWAVLRAHSALMEKVERIKSRRKRRADLQKRIAKLDQGAAEAKREAKRQEKEAQATELRAELEAMADAADATRELGLQSYMLLLDEPEVSLHPNAVRAAQRHLYALAEETGWQVMLTTHAAAFINPLADHTTIIRLERGPGVPSPRTYRSDSVELSEDEREHLRMLLSFDTTLAEVFFGGYPIIVEGDTEYASFERIMQLQPEEFPVEMRPVVLRARGKEAIPPIVRVLRHFEVPFSVLHDGDSPRTGAGAANSAWSANGRILEEVETSRQAGLVVVHRISVPDFERAHGIGHQSSKPYAAWRSVAAEAGVKASVLSALTELMDLGGRQRPFVEDTLPGLTERTKRWAAENAADDPRYAFDA